MSPIKNYLKYTWSMYVDQNTEIGRMGKKKYHHSYILFSSPQLILKYLILFNAIVNENVFFIFFLHCSWLEYKKLNWFLYLPTLLNLFIHSNICFVKQLILPLPFPLSMHHMIKWLDFVSNNLKFYFGDIIKSQGIFFNWLQWLLLFLDNLR